MKTFMNRLKFRLTTLFVAGAFLIGGLAACQETEKKDSLAEQQLALTPENLAGNWDTPAIAGSPTTTQLRFSNAEMTTIVSDGAVAQQSAVSYEISSNQITFPGTARKTYRVTSLTKSRLTMTMDLSDAYPIVLTRNENSSQAVLKPVQQSLALVFKVGSNPATTIGLSHRLNTDDAGSDTVTCRLVRGDLTISAERVTGGKTTGIELKSRRLGLRLRADQSGFNGLLSELGDASLSGRTDQGVGYSASLISGSGDRCATSFKHTGHMLDISIDCKDIDDGDAAKTLDVSLTGQCLLRLF